MHPQAQKFFAATLICTSLISSTFSPVNAQNSLGEKTNKKEKSKKETAFTAEAGLNFSNYKISSGSITLATKDRVSIRLGVGVDIQLKNMLYMEPGIYYSGNGCNLSSPNYNNNGTSKFTLTLGALNIPVVFRYYFENKHHNRFFIGLGPYVAFNLSGTSKDDDGAGTVQNHTMKFGSTSSDDMRPTDIGVASQLGYLWQKGFYLIVSGQNGFKNLAVPPDPNYTSTNSTINSSATAISVGYYLPSHHHVPKNKEKK